MSEIRTYYIKAFTSPTGYTGENLADYLENGPLYTDEAGVAADVTEEIAALRAALSKAQRTINHIESCLPRLTGYTLEQIDGLDDAGLAAEAEVKRLREALEEIADDECTSYRESGRSCEWLGQKWPEGYCYPCIARRALAPKEVLP